MYSCWDSERDGFSENCVVDDRKPCKNGNTHRQQKQNLFWKKNVKIYYSTILNNNCKSEVENSQSYEFTTLVNVKSKVQ